jgi:hypothetical protein
MKIEVALQMIKDLLNPKKQEFNTISLKDGKKISCDNLDAGSVVSNVLENNEIDDLPKGEYELEDGSILVVDEFSKIVEVKAAEVPPVETEKPEETEPENKIEERVIAIEDRLVKIEEALNMILETMSGQATEMSSMKDEFSKRIEKVEEAPAAEPIHFSKPVEQTNKLSDVAAKRLSILNQKK